MSATLRKRIEQVDGQHCVVSDTGRQFGCYTDPDQAAARLAQIERFSKRLDTLPTLEVARLHDACHKHAEPGPDLVTVHDLAEENLEGRQVAPGTSTDVDDKLAALTGGVVKSAADRYTLAPVYVPGVEDSDGEHADAATLQKALWDWVRKGDRTIYLQHSEQPAGEMVEVLTWPFPVETDLAVPEQGVTKFAFPADTPFMGVVWQDWAWDLVKSGDLRGYSIGGRARRVEADVPDLARA